MVESVLHLFKIRWKVIFGNPFIQKIGTNPLLLDKSVSFSFGEPWDSAVSRLAGRVTAEGQSPEAILLQNGESCDWWTYGESNPDFLHAMEV